MKRLLVALLWAIPLAAQPQTYPNKPIRWIVPYTGGGITDVVTRVVTQKMGASIGWPSEAPIFCVTTRVTTSVMPPPV